MSVFVVLVMAVAIDQPISALSPAEEHTCSSTADQRSVLSNMLIMTGYSEVCIAAALDDCGAGHGRSSYAQLIEVVQQLSATVNKLDSHLSAVINMSDATANKLDSHLSAVANISDTLVNVTENISDSLVSVAANKLDSHLSAVVNMSETLVSVAANNKLDSHLSAVVNKVDSHLSAVANMSDTLVSVAANISDTLVSASANEYAYQVCKSLPRNCIDLLFSGDSGSGMRKIYPYPDRPSLGVVVFCDQSVDGGGWTVFQRRTSEATRENFYRNWTDYQAGFGDMREEFWLGLDLLHQLTSTTKHQLRIDLEDYEEQHRYAKYGYFHVDELETSYRLSVQDYSGDAGDSLTYHNGRQFTTHDVDNDGRGDVNCAERRKGAWWYKSCGHSNLNGYQYAGSNNPGWKGIYWYHWRGYAYSLKRTSMMTRPAF